MMVIFIILFFVLKILLIRYKNIMNLIMETFYFLKYQIKKMKMIYLLVIIKILFTLCFLLFVILIIDINNKLRY